MDRSPPGARVAVAGTSSTTRTEVVQPEGSTTSVSSSSCVQEPPVLRLQLQKPKSKKKVAWGNGTIDNEGMNKKKSKCCCIYRKPHEFGESSSDSEEEDCDNCFGHVEKKKNKRLLQHGDSGDVEGSGNDGTDES